MLAASHSLKPLFTVLSNSCMRAIPQRFFGTFKGTEADYERLVDEELSTIESALDTIDDDVDSLDYSIANGVLSISLGSKGNYVINKQTPNKQIWWSSPISGPKRFEYDFDNKKWYETSELDGVKNSRKVDDDINNLFSKEMKSLVGVNLKF